MKSFLSLILISLFSIFFSLSLFAFDLKTVFLNPETLKSSLARNNIYEDLVNGFLPTILVKTLQENGADSDNSETLAQKISIKLVDPAALRQDTEIVLDHLLPYLSGKSENLNFSINLDKYKTNLEKNLKPALLDYFSSLPTCSGKSNPESEALPSCLPKSASVEDLYAEVPAEEIKKNLLERFPRELKITNEKAVLIPAQGSEDKNSPEISKDFKSVNLNSIRETMAKINLGIILGFSASLLCLVFLFLLWFKNYCASLKWTARGLFTTSFVPLLISLTLFFFLSKDLILKLVDYAIGLPTNFDLDPFASLVVSLLKSFSFLLLVQSILLIVISIGITIFLRKYRPNGKII